MKYPKRKPTRLKDYDYSQNGAYFITICTHDKKPLFWETEPQQKNCEPVGANSIRPQLTKYGQLVERAIRFIPIRYPYCRIDNFVIMPNHVHLLLILENETDGRIISSPTEQPSGNSANHWNDTEPVGSDSIRPTCKGKAKSITTIIGQMKRWVSKEVGFSFWQSSFYDHIIRDEEDYLTRWKYIEENPVKWNIREET